MKTCVICGKKFEGWGNNPAPVKDHGRCCDECNWTVIQARFDELAKIPQREEVLEDDGQDR